MKYKVGQVVKVKGSSVVYDSNVKEYFATIVEADRDFDYLVMLPKNLSGKGHNGNGVSKYSYSGQNHWFVLEHEIEYALVGNKIVKS